MKPKLILAIIAACTTGLSGGLFAQAPIANQLREVQSWLQQNQDMQLAYGPTWQQEQTPLSTQQQEIRQQNVQQFQRLIDSQKLQSQTQDWKTPDWRTQYSELQPWQYDWQYDWHYGMENWAPPFDERYQQSQVKENDLEERQQLTQVQQRVESTQSRDIVHGTKEVQQNNSQLQQTLHQAEVVEGTRGHTIVVGSTQIQEAPIHWEQNPIQPTVETAEGHNTVGSAVVQEHTFGQRQAPIVEQSQNIETNTFDLHHEITETQELHQTPDDLVWPGKVQKANEFLATEKQHNVVPGKIVKREEEVTAGAFMTSPKVENTFRRNATRRNATQARTVRTANRGSRKAGGWWMLAPLFLIPLLGWMGWQALRGETSEEKADRLKWESKAKQANTPGLNLKSEPTQNQLGSRQRNGSRAPNSVSEKHTHELKITAEDSSEFRETKTREVEVRNRKAEINFTSERTASQPTRELKIASESCETKAYEKETCNVKAECRHSETTHEQVKLQARETPRSES